MFKKLKDKITEEVKQSPLKFHASVQQLAQAVAPSVTSSTPEPPSNDHFVISEDDSAPEVEKYKNRPETKDDDGMATLSLSRRSSLSSVTNDLFPIYESPSVFNQFQSDLESNASEVEDLFTGHQLDHVSKDKLYTACRKIQARYHKYKGRYTDLVRHYKKLEQENQKAKSILSETQDKALRRIAELKEQCQLEQKAKAHLEEALRNDIEEKDHLISSLNTKIGYLRDGNENGVETESISKTNTSLDSSSTSPPDVPCVPPPVSSGGDASLKEKLKKLEELLQKSKGVIMEKMKTINDLNKENAELKFEINELATAKDEVASLRKLVSTLQKSEEEVALSTAESKQSIFLELESKEAQIKRLKETVADVLQEKTQLSDKVKSLETTMLSSEDVADKIAQLQKEMDLKLTTTENNFTSLMIEKDQLTETLREENSALQKELESKVTELERVKKTVEELNETSEKELSLKEAEINLLKENLSKAQSEVSHVKNNSFNEILKQNKSDDCKMQSEKISEVSKEPPILVQEETPSLSVPPEEIKSSNELKNIVKLLKTELVEKENKLRHINEHSMNNSTKLNLSLEKVNQMENDFRSKRDEWVEMKVQYQKQVDEHLIEIQRLKENIEHLSIKLREKEEKVAEYDSEISSLNKTLMSVKEELSLKSQENDGLQNRVSNFDEKILKFNNMLKEFTSERKLTVEAKNAEVYKLNQDICAKSIEIKNLLDTNLNLQSKVDLLNKTVEAKESSLKELETCLAGTEGRLESEKSSLKLLNEELVSKCTNLENLLVSKEEEIRSHKSLVTNLENSISMLKKQLESGNHEEEIKSLQSKISELKKNNDESATKIQNYESNLTEVSAKLQDSELKLQTAEQIKQKLEDSIKEKKEECMSYINDHNELVKIKSILDKSNLSVNASVSELINDLVNLNQSASEDKLAVEKLKLELEVVKRNEEKRQKTFIQSLDLLKKAKQDIFYLKQELAKALTLTKSDCSKLFDDCLNYSIKFVEDKKINFDRTIESFKHREIELNSMQSKLNEKIKVGKENLNSKNAKIEDQEKKISEVTSTVENLESILIKNSECMKEFEFKLIGKDKMIEELNERIDSLNDIESRYLKELSGKESEITDLKSKLKELENQQATSSIEKDKEWMQHIEENRFLTQELIKYKDFEEKLGKEKEVSRSLLEELQDAKQDFEKLESEFETLRQKSLSMGEKLKEKCESYLSEDLPTEIENLERRHKQEILEIEKRYASLMAEKYKEYEVLETKYHEQELEQERRRTKEVKEIMKDVKETEELQSEQLEEFRLQLKRTEDEASANVRQLKQEHLMAMSATIKKWREFLDKKVIELEQKHSDEVAALTKEWNHERKTNCEIVTPSNAVSENQELEAIANSTGDEKENLHSLNIQIKALKKEIDEEKNYHRLEVQELQKLLSKRNSSRHSKEFSDRDIEDCTEMEYLRNILYEYMMGKEPVVLARVLAAIVKFDSEQTSRVMQKEEQRFSLLGQLGMS